MGASVVALDLDDTLYPEVQFVMSGFGAVSRCFGRSEEASLKLFERMAELFHANPSKVFDRLVTEPDSSEMIQPEVIDSARSGSLEWLVRKMLDCYRKHEPAIEPYSDVPGTLDRLAAMGVRLALVTDGDTDVQVRKVHALGLAQRFDLIVYTDSLGPDRRHWKPSRVPFEAVLGHFSVPASAVCYVGDNPGKDFRTPSEMGIATVRIVRPDGLHRLAPAGKEVAHVVRALDEILALPLFD